MVKLSCNDINRNIEDFCYLQDCIDMSSCSCCHMMCRASFAPAVNKLSCSTCKACSHVCITEGKDRSFFVYTFCYNKFEVSVFILCDCKIGNRTCVWIELCQISAACFAMATFMSPSTAHAVPCLISMENAGISILSRTPALP